MQSRLRPQRIDTLLRTLFASLFMTAVVACGTVEAVDERSTLDDSVPSNQPFTQAIAGSDLEQLFTLHGPLAAELSFSMPDYAGTATDLSSPAGNQAAATAPLTAPAPSIASAPSAETLGGAAKLASVMIDAPLMPSPALANALSTPHTGGPVAPAALSAADKWADEGEAVTFSGSFVDPGVLDTHTIRWNFGDGVETLNVLAPTHVYRDNGVYKVTLGVTDKDGDVGTASIDVLVYNQPPSADLGPARLISEGELTTFDASVSDPGQDDTHTFKWFFEPGANPIDGSGTMTYSYPDEGVYVVSVTVVDDDGGSGTSETTVHVLNVPPAVQAGPDQTADEGSMISFVGNFLDPGVQDVHNITWDFGDGTVVGGTLTPTHVYLDDGAYSVTLTVTDNDGGVGTDTLQVKVLNKPPVVQIAQ